MPNNEAMTGTVVALMRDHPFIDDIDLMGLLADHGRLRALCRRLEDCADALPDRPAPAVAAALARDLTGLLPACHAREEDRLVTMFGQQEDRLTRALLQRIRACHIAEAVHAQDLSTALVSGRGSDGFVATDALAYMLRCCFEGCRHAIRLEELAVLALGDHRLTTRARALIEMSLVPNAANG